MLKPSGEAPLTEAVAKWASQRRYPWVWENLHGDSKFRYPDLRIGNPVIKPDVVACYYATALDRHSIAVEVKPAKHYTAGLFHVGQAIRYLRAFDEVYMATDYSLLEVKEGHQPGAFSLEVLRDLGMGYLFVKWNGSSFEIEEQLKPVHNKKGWLDRDVYELVWKKIVDQKQKE